MPFSAGSGKNYYTNARWQVNVNGLYQLPAGFEIAANLFGRQGYPSRSTCSSTPARSTAT